MKGIEIECKTGNIDVDYLIGRLGYYSSTRHKDGITLDTLNRVATHALVFIEERDRFYKILKRVEEYAKMLCDTQEDLYQEDLDIRAQERQMQECGESLMRKIYGADWDRPNREDYILELRHRAKGGIARYDIGNAELMGWAADQLEKEVNE